MAVLFNGSNQRIDIANESFFDWDWPQAFSVACWMYVPTNAIEAGGAAVISKAGPPGWALDMNLPPGEAPTFSLHLISSPGSEIWKFGPDQAWPRGLWAHIAATYDGSSNISGMALYLNGVAVGGGGGVDINTPAGSLLGNNPLAVGGIGSGGEWCNIAVSNCVLDKRVWTPAEVRTLADLANFTRNANDFIAGGVDWQAKLTTVTDLADYSGNANSGTLVGAPTTQADPKVVFIGPRGTGTVSGTSQVITFTTTYDIPVGAQVVLGDVHYNQHGNITGVTVGSLSLALDKLQVLGTLPVNVEIWSGRATALIPSGTTVTVTYTTSTADVGVATLIALGGIGSTSPLDQTVGAFNETAVTTFDTGTTAATAMADEFAVSLFGFGTSASTPIVTPQSGWTEIYELLTGNLHLELAVKALTATGTQRHQPTSSTAQSYAGALTTYKGVVPGQQLRPDADLTTAGWTTTPLWSKVDEVVAAGDVITATAV